MPDARRQQPVVILVSDSESETQDSDDDVFWLNPRGEAAAAADQRIELNAAPGPRSDLVATDGVARAYSPPGRNLATPSLAPMRPRQDARIPNSPAERQVGFVDDEYKTDDRRNDIARQLAEPTVVEEAIVQSQEPTMDVTQADTVLPLIVEVIPDICPNYALKLIKEQLILQSTAAGAAAARVVEIIFENWPYPTIEKGKGKRKREGGDGEERSGSGSDGSKRQKDEMLEVVEGVINYRSLASGLAERKGQEYLNRALRTLENTFPLVTVKYIRSTYNMCNNLYVPTHFELARQADLPADKRDYKDQERPRPHKGEVPKRVKIKGKGKAKAKGKARLMMETIVEDQFGEGSVVMVEDDMGEGAFMNERAWLISWLSSKDGPQPLEYIKLIDPPDTEGDVECQCCFSEEYVQYMVQCEEGHLFCRECVQRLIENAIGEHKIVHCMDGSGCAAVFPARELRKAVVRKMLEVYHNILQRKELEAAGIQGLESCPACEYAVVIENEYEKLFRCEMEDCGLVSCRSCRKPDHIPKSCQEAQKDRKLDTRHTVEEAMTEALVRTCPNPACNQTFIKELGCNKITCTKCSKVSCYVCRKLITDGYSHFDQGSALDAYNKGKDSKKCRLWDPKTEDVYAADVARAREAAQQRARAEAAEAGEAIEEPDIDVALPEARVDHGLARPPVLARFGDPAVRLDAARMAAPGRHRVPVEDAAHYLDFHARLAAPALPRPRILDAARRQARRQAANLALPAPRAYRPPGGGNVGEAAQGLRVEELMREVEEQRRLLMEQRRLLVEAGLGDARNPALERRLFDPYAPPANAPQARLGIHLPEHIPARLPLLPPLPPQPPQLPQPLLPPLYNMEREDDDLFA